MAGKLRAVGADEKPVAVEPPKTLADATERDRRSLLVRARLEIANAIDAGVPAHALGRLITDMNGIDSEIRRLDALEKQEAERAPDVDESFNSAAI